MGLERGGNEIGDGAERWNKVGGRGEKWRWRMVESSGGLWLQWKMVEKVGSMGGWKYMGMVDDGGVQLRSGGGGGEWGKRWGQAEKWWGIVADGG